MDNNGHNRINEEKSDVYIKTMIYNILCNLMSPFLPPCAVLTCGNSQKSKDADIKGIAAWRHKIIVFAVNNSMVSTLFPSYFGHVSLKHSQTFWIRNHCKWKRTNVDTNTLRNNMLYSLHPVRLTIFYYFKFSVKCV